MIYLWVDANVVLRFITGEPPEMAAQALELMARAENGEVCLRLPHLAVAEIVWVLSSFYQFTKREIADTLISFINADGMQVDNSDLVIQALQDMAKKMLILQMPASRRWPGRKKKVFVLLTMILKS